MAAVDRAALAWLGNVDPHAVDAVFRLRRQVAAGDAAATATLADALERIRAAFARRSRRA